MHKLTAKNLALALVCSCILAWIATPAMAAVVAKSLNGVKHKYNITFVSASYVPDGANVYISWKRGAMKENKGSIYSKPVKSGIVDFNETVAIICTLFKEGVGYEAKVLHSSKTIYFIRMLFSPLKKTTRLFYINHLEK